jgi:hypothetical protein
MREVFQNAAFVVFLSVVMLGTVILFVRVIQRTGSGYSDHLRKLRAARETSATYLERNLEAMDRQNVLLERIAEALERAHPSPGDSKKG